MSPKEKQNFFTKTKTVFRSFSEDFPFRACYLKVLSTFLKYKTTQVALLYGKNI